MNLEIIGRQIRYYRQKAKLTQEELGREVGVTWEMVSRYERGVSSPLGRLDRIAEALSVDPTALLQESYIPNQVREGSPANKVPLFTTIPRKYDFSTGNTQYFYTAPDWVVQLDRDVFMVDSAIVHIKTARMQKNGPIYISPSIKPDNDDLVLFRAENKLQIAPKKSTPKGTPMVGTVIAQEYRLKR